MFSGIKVHDDHPGCPPHICRGCVLKLKRGMGNLRNHQKLSVSFNVPDFPVPNMEQPSVPENMDIEVNTPGSSTSTCDTEQCNCVSSTELCCHFIEQAKLLAKANHFCNSSDSESEMLVFVSLKPGAGSVLFTIVIKKDYTWFLKYENDLLDTSICDFFNSISAKLNIKSLEQTLTFLSSSAVCSGNIDFLEIVEESVANGQNNLVSHDRNTIVGYINGSSIRCVQCPIFLPQGHKLARCEFCTKLRGNLRARKSVINKRTTEFTSRTSATSSVNYHCLSTEEKSERLKEVKKESRKNLRKVNALEAIIAKKLDNESVSLNSEQNNFLISACKTVQDDIAKQWDVDSPQRLFWDQQIKRNQCKNPTSMRWHPTIIRWCISLYMKGSKSYEQLRRSGFVALPSVSTIKSYLHFTDPKPGVNSDVMEVLAEEFHLKTAEEYKRNVCLVWDEVKIKSGLAVSLGSGRLVGFTCMDDISSELGALSNMDEAEVNTDIATHLMVFMVRGLANNVNLPFMYFPCTGYNSPQLWGSVWTATQSLEELGLKVRAWVCDGATANRRFFKAHDRGNKFEGIQFSCLNRCNMTRQIFFICDVPHLLKTTRNNLENSYSNLKSRTLTKNNKQISWLHIASTFEEDIDQNLGRLPRIKHEHIHLSPQLRMRVKLAAQVLSTSMSNAIIARGLDHMSETSNFCKQFDSWFDCLNGRYMFGGIQKRNLNLQPYHKLDDRRFHWLETDFLGWIKGWETEINDLPDLTKAEKNKFILSYQTLEGIKITTKSFVTLTKQLLATEGVKYIIPEKMNQDRLEVFFGKLRRSCGDNDNPTVHEAQNRIMALLVAGRHILAPRNTNSVAQEDAENVSLKKQKQKRSKITL